MPVKSAGESVDTSYICSCYKLTGLGMAIPPICYCNHKLRGSKKYPYRCVNVEKLPNSPWLTDACASSG